MPSFGAGSRPKVQPATESEQPSPTNGKRSPKKGLKIAIQPLAVTPTELASKEEEDEKSAAFRSNSENLAASFLPKIETIDNFQPYIDKFLGFHGDNDVD